MMNISSTKHTQPETASIRTNRYAGLDILKVLAIVFIPSVHFCSYFFQNEDNDLMFVIMHAFRWLFFSGTCLFITISGYLNASKQFSKKHFLSIVRLYLVYWVYCTLDAFILHENTSFETVKYYALSYPAYYWYVSFWISMMFFLPFINKAVENCTLKEYLIFAGTLFVFLSLPCVLSQLELNYNLPDIGIDHNFPILFYVIGAGFKKFSFKINKYVSLASVIITLLLHGLFDFLYCQKYNVIGTHLYICDKYSNPFTVIVVVSIFSLLYDIKHIQGGGIFAFISKMSFSMYLGLIIADYAVSPLKSYTDQWLYEHNMSYKLSYFSFVFGELFITFTLACIVKIAEKILLYLIAKIKQHRRSTIAQQ